MEEIINRIVNDKADSVVLTRGQRGNYGFECKIYGDLLSDEGQAKLMEKLESMAKKLEQKFSKDLNE